MSQYVVWWWQVWIRLPLVDRVTGEWSLSRTIAAGFSLAVIHVIEHSHTVAAGTVALAILSLSAAFGKRLFEAMATRIIGKVPNG